MSHECAACSETGQPLLAFWDGQPYCRACITEIAPHALPLVLAGESRYCECILPGKRWVLRRYLRQAGIFFVIVQVLFVGIVLLSGPARFVDVLQLGGFVALVWAAVMLFFSPILFIIRRMAPMHLSIESGQFIVSTERGVWCSWPASSTQWHIGSSSEDPRLRPLVPNKKAIVLTRATKVVGLSFSSGAVACGLTDDAFQVWLETCKLAGIVERKGLFT